MFSNAKYPLRTRKVSATPTPSPTPTPTPTPTSSPTPTPTPTGTPTPTSTGGVSSGPAWTYSFSTSNRNDFTGFVGAQVVLINNGAYNFFNLTQVGVPYQAANLGAYGVTVYVLNSSGAQLGSYALTVASGTAFAFSYVTVAHQFAAGATFNIVIATTNGGFRWNDVGGNSISAYNAVPPSSLTPVLSATGCYLYSIPSTPGLFGGNASYGGLLARGYTS